MRHDERRKELGKMLMDVAKYLATVGIIGSVLTNGLTFIRGLVIGALFLFLVVLAFFVIPTRKGE